ncbi:MAG: hypothetical protein LBB21_04065 [Holosporaceae bacterium]|nr:hypothetical protein [Holosporaceae bacterium]
MKFAKHSDYSAVGLKVAIANCLATEITSYQFVMVIIIWHDILFHINKVRKLMQNPSANVTVMIKLVEATKQFLQKFGSAEKFEAHIKSGELITVC